MASRTFGLLVLVACAAASSGCGKKRDAEETEHGVAPSASVAPAPRVASPPSASAHPPSPTPAAAPSSSGAAPVDYSFDAGTNGCRLLYGPAQQPFIGELALVPTDTGALVVTHHDGFPTVTRLTPEAKAVRTTIDAAVPTVTSPPCAVAGPFSLCMDPSGAIHQRSLETEGRDVVVARATPGTHFAAELIDSVHVVVAYLAERRTSEGLVSQAYVVVDQQPPLRLSEDGTGTTDVVLAPHGASLLALLLDGRIAMTPVHARTLGLSGGKLILGEDAVVFVGGAAEPRTQGALGTSMSGTVALTAIAGEAGFGMAVIHLDDPPRLDEPTTWSNYLNGLDPAPIAATRGLSPIRVARVRPLEVRANGPRGLELGKLDDAGAFTSYGLVGSHGRVTSATMAADKAGTIWLAFTDGAGTWVERRACP